MVRLSSRRGRFGLALGATLIGLVASSSPVAADTGPAGDGTFTQNGTSAYASTNDCESNGDGTTTCRETGVSIFDGKMSNDVSGVTHSRQVCVFLGTSTRVDETGELVDELGYEAGCLDPAPSKSLVFGRNLASAELASTVVSIQRFVCQDKGSECVPGPTRDVSVSGSWTGVGAIFTGRDRAVGDDGVCRYAQSESGSNRAATFTGAIDGQDLVDDFASLQVGKVKFRSRCVTS